MTLAEIIYCVQLTEKTRSIHQTLGNKTKGMTHDMTAVNDFNYVCKHESHLMENNVNDQKLLRAMLIMRDHLGK